MNFSPRILLLLAIFVASTVLSPAAEKTLTFKVKGANPGGATGYDGTVTLTQLSQATAKIVWTTGTNKEVTEGIALRSESGLAAGYGGAALYALAVYEIKDKGKGKSISALWTMSTNPKESGAYELKGSDFAGRLPFADGTPGAVTFTAGADGMYKVAWELNAGKYEGIGLRMGNVLLAASGDVKAGFGLAGYVPKGEDMEGLWATTDAISPGTETWSEAQGDGPSPQPPVAAAATPAAPEKPAMSDKELEAAIKEDLEKCGVIARKFMTSLQAGEVSKAVALISDPAFTKVSRADFETAIAESNKVFGAMKSFKPDREATDVAVKDGVVNFTLQADAEYERARVRETLLFIRNKEGGVELFGYNRTAKE